MESTTLCYVQSKQKCGVREKVRLISALRGKKYELLNNSEIDLLFRMINKPGEVASTPRENFLFCCTDKKKYIA